MSLGAVAKIAQLPLAGAGPFFFQPISVVGPGTYSSGGDDLLTPFRVLTHNKAKILALVPIDAQGYGTSYMASDPTKESVGTGPFALAEGMTLKFKANRETEHLITFKTNLVINGQNVAMFVDITAATAAEVAAYINYMLGGMGIVASVTNTNHVTVKVSDGTFLQFTGGTANELLLFALTEAADAGLLKLWIGNNDSSDGPMVEAAGTLSGSTYKYLAIYR